MLQQRACIKQKSIARCLQPQSETGREKIDETANIRLLQSLVLVYGEDTGFGNVIVGQQPHQSASREFFQYRKIG
jgi:hypothetical protein